MDRKLPGSLSLRRDCHVFLLLDTSASMAGHKISILNFTVASLIPEMRRIAERAPTSNIVVHALTFGTEAVWVKRETPIEQFEWPDVYLGGGQVAVGKALDLVTDALDRLDSAKRFYPPILILLGDTLPTDDFGTALQRLKTCKLGRYAIRVAISLEASHQDGIEFLREFVSDPSNLITHDQAVRLLPQLLKVASKATVEESPRRDMASAARQNPGDEVIW